MDVSVKLLNSMDYEVESFIILLCSLPNFNYALKSLIACIEMWLCFNNMLEKSTATNITLQSPNTIVSDDVYLESKT